MTDNWLVAASTVNDLRTLHGGRLTAETATGGSVVDHLDADNDQQAPADGTPRPSHLDGHRSTGAVPSPDHGVVVENVRHHVEEEASEFFPKMRKELGRNELADIGESLADAKKSAATRPHPRMPDAGPASAVAGAITGAVDRVADNINGIAQGSVAAAQDLVARVTGSDRPKVSPTGSSTAWLLVITASVVTT